MPAINPRTGKQKGQAFGYNPNIYQSTTMELPKGLRLTGLDHGRSSVPLVLRFMRSVRETQTVGRCLPEVALISQPLLPGCLFYRSGRLGTVLATHSIFNQLGRRRRKPPASLWLESLEASSWENTYALAIDYALKRWRQLCNAPMWDKNTLLVLARRPPAATGW